MTTATVQVVAYGPVPGVCRVEKVGRRFAGSKHLCQLPKPRRPATGSPSPSSTTSGLYGCPPRIRAVATYGQTRSRKWGMSPDLSYNGGSDTRARTGVARSGVGWSRSGCWPGGRRYFWRCGGLNYGPVAAASSAASNVGAEQSGRSLLRAKRHPADSGSLLVPR